MSSDRIEQKKLENMQLENEITELKQEIILRKEKNTSLEHEKEALKKEVTTMNLNNCVLKTEIEKLKTEIDDTIDSYEQNIEELEMKIASLQKENEIGRFGPGEFGEVY